MPNHGIEMLLVFSFTYQETLNYATQKTDSAELMCARKFQMQFLNLLKLRWLKKQVKKIQVLNEALPLLR